MAALTVHYVTSLPGTLVANALYFVLSGTAAETYVTGTDAVGRYVGNSALIDERIAAAGGGGGGQTAEIVDDIAARDTLFTGSENIQALVVDASADATVDSGSALYAYRGSDGAVFKIGETESLDVVLQWTAIQGRPSSTAAQIDAAVSAATHTNRSSLNKIGEDAAGDITYDGRGVVTLATADW